MKIIQSRLDQIRAELSTLKGRKKDGRTRDRIKQLQEISARLKGWLTIDPDETLI